MDILILTGVSGSGKTLTAKALEDFGYFCIDNLPPRLIPDAIALANSNDIKTEKLVIVTDIRAGDMLSDLEHSINDARRKYDRLRVIFLDAADDALAGRYQLTRRSHPLMGQPGITNIASAIAKEREMLSYVRGISDIVIDTTELTGLHLKEKVATLLERTSDAKMTVSIVSFSFMRGVPRDANLMFDVRCLPNPFYIPELKSFTGKDKDVYEYVFAQKESLEYYDRMASLLMFSLPLYIKEGKSRLVIAIGCTGGKHRSVAFAEKLHTDLAEQGFSVTVEHREI